jgi:hypothetical protein
MKMSNVHERTIAAPAALVGALLDTLASADDKFRPHENWPRVKLGLSDYRWNPPFAAVSQSISLRLSGSLDIWCENTYFT